MTKNLKPVLRANLLALAREYAASEKIPLRIVSQRAYNDSRFFGRLASNSNSFTIDKYDELVVWFTEHWPEGSAMPVLIDPRHEQEKPNGSKAKTI